jgi:A-kinase anchor protein 13
VTPFVGNYLIHSNFLYRFEGVAMLMQGRGKVQLVFVIVLSDVLLFLVENSNKYSFFTPDNKVMYMCHVDHLYK